MVAQIQLPGVPTQKRINFAPFIGSQTTTVTSDISEAPSSGNRAFQLTGSTFSSL